MSANQNYAPSASLNKTPLFALSSPDEKGIFISTRTKHALVTALLWSGLIAVCASSWYGAILLGVRFARWIGA